MSGRYLSLCEGSRAELIEALQEVVAENDLFRPFVDALMEDEERTTERLAEAAVEYRDAFDKLGKIDKLYEEIGRLKRVAGDLEREVAEGMK